MKKAFYFSHDANARNDEKILMLRAEHGWNGYGIYWALIEMMFENDNSSLQHKNVKGIAIALNVDIHDFEAIINTAINHGLFVSNGWEFWSESLRHRKANMELLKQRQAEGGRRAMYNRYKKLEIKSLTSDLKEVCNNKINNIKDINKINENESNSNKTQIYADILEYLNSKTGKNFKLSGRKNISVINARLNEGYTIEDFKKVIDIKTAQWLNDPKMEQYLCPETLFSPKFEKYLNQKFHNNNNKDDNNNSKNTRPRTISDLEQSARNFQETYREGNFSITPIG